MTTNTKPSIISQARSRSRINNSRCSMKRSFCSTAALVVLAAAITLMLLTLPSTYADSSMPGAGALQSGPDLAGSTFPAQVYYDPAKHMVWIVGSTFGRSFTSKTTGTTTVSTVPRKSSHCFIASVSLPTDIDNNNHMSWTSRQTLVGSSDSDNDAVAMEACSGLVFQEQRMVLLGHSERNGLMEELYSDGQVSQATMYGMLMDMEQNQQNTANWNLKGGRVLQESVITYPMAMTTASTAAANQKYLYIVSQETDSAVSDEVSGQTTTTTTTTSASGGIMMTPFDISNEQDPMRFFKYGNGQYRMTIRQLERLHTTNNSPNLEETFTEGWQNPISTLEVGSSVHVAGMAEMGDQILVVVGTTDGTGDYFGGQDDAVINGSPTGSNMDGFITKLNVLDGQAFVDTTASTTNTNIKSSHRIQSMNGADDWIAGMCHDYTNDPDHIYIVGATEGQLDSFSPSVSNNNNNVEAFAMKLNLGTLETVWTEQIGAVAVPTTTANVDGSTQVRGISCAVSPDGKSLWVGGVVQDDAVLPDSGTTESFGGDDVFVAKLQAEDGVRLFVRQFGSTQDDGMAMRGGLAVDKLGNCIVVGSTYGDLYRQRQPNELQDQPMISDVFVTTIRGDNGDISLPASHPEFVQPTTNTEGQTSSNAAPPTGNGNNNGGNVEAPTFDLNNNKSDASTGDHQHPKNVLIFLVALCFGGVAALLLVRRATKSSINRDVSTDRSHVIEYLSEFDVDDVDLKHSATGGWHCSYSNDLANGRNRRAEQAGPGVGMGLLPPSDRVSHGRDPLLSPPSSLKDTRVVNDSLFMDEEDAGEFGVSGGGSFDGRSFGESRSSQRQGYDGLIDAYNATWNDRRGGGDLEPRWGKEIL